MNGQSAAEVKQQILDTLASLTMEDRTPAVNGTLNVAFSNAPVRDESAQPQPVPEASPDPAVHSTTPRSDTI